MARLGVGHSYIYRAQLLIIVAVDAYILNDPQSHKTPPSILFVCLGDPENEIAT